MTTRLLLVVVVAVVVAGPAVAHARVVVLGFDGADPLLIEEYRRRGLMPHFDRLAREGTYRLLVPSNPAQTPVSWAAFSTGMNPGRTGIFDFLQREPGRYEPDLALVTVGRRKFLFGAGNGVATSLLAGVLAGLLAAGAARACRAGRRRCVALGAAVLVLSAAALAPLFGELLPVEVPAAENNRRGQPFWTLAAEAGYDITVHHVPVTFPAEVLPAGSTLLSGLGVPDIRGRVGTPSFYTSDPAFDPGDNQFSLELVRLPVRRGAVETSIVGPYNYPFHVYVLDRRRKLWQEEEVPAAEIRRREQVLGDELTAAGHPRRIDLPLRLNVHDDRLEWEVSGQQGTLRPGEWSEWVVLDFPLNWLVDRLQPLRGMARFKLIALETEVELYLSPVNFHVSSHPVPYSSPPGWAEELARHVGLFKTLGWAIDTWSYPSGVGGIDLFLEDMWFTVDKAEAILEHALADPDVDMVVHVFEFTDRAGHMLWHELDRGHPLFRPELEPRYQRAMEDVYRRMDAIIGRTASTLAPDDLFVVLSDHGFASFRRQINVNTWLHQHGYLVLKKRPGRRNLEQLFDADVSGVSVFSGIDWSRTRAWAMGLGSIYVNLVGREQHGIVMPGREYDELVEEIADGLEAAVDPATGERPVARVYHRDELYHGYDPDRVPDLRLTNHRNYRISWQDTLGGLSTAVFEDNERLWSGDHCTIDPAEIRGILLVNRTVDEQHPTIYDLAPSILRELRVSPGEDLDGHALW